jgi:hypothetical protein
VGGGGWNRQEERRKKEEGRRTKDPQLLFSFSLLVAPCTRSRQIEAEMKSCGRVWGPGFRVQKSSTE